MCQLANNEEASEFMIKLVDFDPETRTPMPDVISAEELQQFPITAERHVAYEQLWNGVACAGILANAAMWLYL